MNKISVVGVGRLGLSFALIAEQAGYHVIGCDVRADHVDQLNNKTFRTPEPHIEELLKASSNFFATENIGSAIAFSDFIFVFVPTPSKPNDEYDHQYVEQVVDSIFTYEKWNELNTKTLVICCTVMPGYCKSLHERLSAYEINVVYQPEFIAQNEIVHGIKNADFVLIGCDRDYDVTQLMDIYVRIMDIHPQFKLLTHTAAELTKISINCYLTLKIAFANMVGEIAINSGEEENVSDILDAIGTDKRIGKKFLSYGFPAAGLCLPRDLRALEMHMANIGLQPDFIDNIVAENDRHMEFLKDYYINKNPDKNFPFIFNQLGYKKNVDILTESQHYQLCKELLNTGYKVNIVESESVINQVKKELEIYGDRVTYGNGAGTVSNNPERKIEGQRKRGFVIDL